MASETERRNLQRSEQWGRSWNNNVVAMVNECYATDCVVSNMLTGDIAHGRDELRKLEHDLRSLTGARRMEITRAVASGDKVAIQIDIVRQDQRSKTCAFLTFDEDGMIKLENWYGEGAAGRAIPAR